MTHHMLKQIDELVSYKEDGINTAMLARSGDNIAILIALKKDQKMEEHTSPVDAFAYVIYGEVEFAINEEAAETYTIKTGDFFFFKAEEKHTILALKDSKILVVRMS